MMDDRMEEFFDELPEPPREEAERIDPWHRPMALIAWGVLLTTVILNFAGLSLLLPPVGMLLMYLGLRPLRRENGGFKWAYIMAWGRLILTVVVYAARMMPFYGTEAATALTVFSLFFQLAQLVCLRAGLAGVFDLSGAPRRLGAVNWLIAFTLMLAVGALLDIGNMGALGLFVLAGYIAVIAAVARLAGSLGDAGCVLRNAPSRLSDAVIAVVALGTLLAVTVAAWLSGLMISTPKAEPFAPAHNASLAELLPGEIAELLSEEDAALFEGAENVQFTWSDGVQGMNRLKRLRLCTVTAQLSDARLLILQYFRWTGGGPKFGDSVILWQSHALSLRGIPRGGVFYELGGGTYRSGLSDLAWGTRTTHGLFENTSPYIWADVFVPMNAENSRGYVIYTVDAGTELQLNYNCQVKYYHRTARDSLFVPQSPSETQFSGGFDHGNRAVFDTLFSAWSPEK